MVQDAWKDFELSGKVTDYLTYRQKSRQTDAAAQMGGVSDLERGMNGYGTERSSDGNDIKGNAGWGV